MSQFECELDILLHEEDSCSFPIDISNGIEHLLNDNGSKAQGGLMQDEECGRGHRLPILYTFTEIKGLDFLSKRCGKGRG
jgi:hypothetical protein